MRTAALASITLAFTALAFAAPLAAAPAKPPADAKAAADRFNLDLAPAGEDSAATAPEAAPETKTRYSLDTPIGQLLANYKSKAVLDKDMPGLSTDKNIDKFRALTLRRLAPLSGGRLSPELLEKVGKHLAEIE